MRLRFTRDLPCPPHVAWALVTEPAAMNTWSSARIEGGPCVAGGTRTVRLRVGGIPARLEETLLEVAPPERLVYTVVRGGGLCRHRGEQRLEPIAGGTRLTWTVDFAAWVPGAELRL